MGAQEAHARRLASLQEIHTADRLRDSKLEAQATVANSGAIQEEDARECLRNLHKYHNNNNNNTN